jgi:SnoaL-like domain
VGNRQVVERYTRALADDDVDAQVALLHPDYVGRYPQSGEVIRGPANFVAVTSNYPGRGERGLRPQIEGIRGADDQWITRPSWPAWTVVHLAGSDDEFTFTGTIRYPNGEVWHAIGLVSVREGKIWRETDYFAAPFECPEWRRPFVELEGSATAGDG